MQGRPENNPSQAQHFLVLPCRVWLTSGAPNCGQPPALLFGEAFENSWLPDFVGAKAPAATAQLIVLQSSERLAATTDQECFL